MWAGASALWVVGVVALALTLAFDRGLERQQVLYFFAMAAAPPAVLGTVLATVAWIIRGFSR